MFDSLTYAKEHKKAFLEKLLQDKAVSVNKDALFMAGSPGAGKTEVASTLTDMMQDIVHIDADDFRSQFPGYNGSNSSDFQKGASYLVDYCYTEVLKKGFSFILDGTFAIEKSLKNIERALGRGYNVEIYYTYQDPLRAWEFTKLREKKEGRLVPKETFIRAFFQSRKNIAQVQEAFGNQVNVNIVFKDFQNNISDIHFNVEHIDLILPLDVTRDELEERLDE